MKHDSMKEAGHYALLGDGRLARHLRHYLQLEGHACSGWARNPRSDFNSHAHTDAEARLRATVAPASHVILAVADDALAPLLKRYPFLHQHRLIHCAGALSLPGVAGAHPLMTFGAELYELEDYRAIPFMVEAGHDFASLFPGLPNPHHAIAAEDKAEYHALCVMAGNFPQVLWRAVGGRLADGPGVPREALAAYLGRALENFLADPEGALTGPLARGDNATLERNLAALGQDPLAELYRSFVRFHGEERRTPEWKENVS